MENIMKDIGFKNKIVSVIGSGNKGPQDQIAFELGQLIGKARYYLLNGGGSGIMKASARGAAEAGGIVVGMLPSNSVDDPRFAGKFPNPYVHIPIFTGLSDARNAIIVKSADIVVAFRGGAGTLSEISLAIKNKKFVLIVNWEDLILPESFSNKLFRHVEGPEEAFLFIEKFLNR
jgi:uncharacterized protein (TIGR00725 family)